jgi:hypothetical protein
MIMYSGPFRSGKSSAGDPGRDDSRRFEQPGPDEDQRSGTRRPSAMAQLAQCGERQSSHLNREGDSQHNARHRREGYHLRQKLGQLAQRGVLEGRQLLVPLEIEAAQAPRQVQEVTNLEQSAMRRRERTAGIRRRPRDRRPPLRATRRIARPTGGSRRPSSSASGRLKPRTAWYTDSTK